MAAPLTLTQLTQAAAGSSETPALSADGTHLAFRSTQDLTGGNPDGNAELFLLDTPTHALTQLTHSTGGTSGAPVLSAGGTRLAFHSKQDLTGGNPDGNYEIFLVDTATRTLTQLTDTTDVTNAAPTINATGSRVAFEAESTLSEAFTLLVVDTATHTLTPLLHATEGARFHAALDASGSRLLFASAQDLTGGNSDGSQELFLASYGPP